MAASVVASTGVRPDPFGEHVSVMKALYQEYQKVEDFDAMSLISSILSEARNSRAEREDTVKNAIRELSREVSNAEASSSYPNPEGAHERKVAVLKADINGAQDQIRQLSSTGRELELRQASVQQRMADIVAHASALERQVAQEEPRLRHQLSLFAHISKITWRLDQEDRISGTVSDTKNSDIRTVDIDPASMSYFETVNKLWQLL